MSKDPQVKRLKAGRPQSLSSRGREILRFIWRFGSVGTKSVIRFVAPNASPYAVSKELIKLEDKGLIEGEKPWIIRQFLWTISQKGFSEIEGSLEAELCGLRARIECSILQTEESERELWYRRNQSAQILHQILMELAWRQEPVGLTERELLFTSVAKSKDWLPPLRGHTPSAVLKWSDDRRPKVIAIDCHHERQNIRNFERTARTYRNRRWHKVIIVLAEEYNSMKSRIHFFDRGLKNLDLPIGGKFVFTSEEGLYSGEMADVFDIHGDRIGSLESVLFDRPYNPHGSTKHRGIVDDIQSRPKVLGRAYQREQESKA